MSHDTRDDPVEAYLDQLLLTLSGWPREIRSTLAEAEAHLHDAVAEGQAAGLSLEQARREALERFGGVEHVAGRRGVLTGSAAWSRRLALIGMRIAAVALIAVGVAGAIARGLWALRGARFVGVVWAPGDYTNTDCARWQAGFPGHGCAAAMAMDHAGDFVLQAAAAGICGVLVLFVYLWLRRRWQSVGIRMVLPVVSGDVIGVILAGACAVGLLGVAADQELVGNTSGVGQQLSLGVAALLACAFFAAAIRLARRSRNAAAA